MVGGRVIEVFPMTMGCSLGAQEVVRLWVMDTKTADELCVYVRPASILPEVGEEVWWQSGQVMFANDKYRLEKVGYSFRPYEGMPGPTP
jgi:hypothetical protein